MHHFADDKNHLYSSSSLKSINKHINHDLKLVVHHLRANRVSLNVDKTDIILFRSKDRKVEKKLNFCIIGQNSSFISQQILRYSPTSWDQYLKMLKQKLSRDNGFLAKTRYYLPSNLRKTIQFNSIFESNFRYGCQIWRQRKSKHIHDIELQRKAVRIINFKSKYAPSNPQNHSLQTENNDFSRHYQVRKVFIGTAINKQNITIKLTEPIQNC